MFESFWGDFMSQVDHISSEENAFALTELKTILPVTIKYEFKSLVVFFKVRRPYDYIILKISVTLNTLNDTANFDLKYFASTMYTVWQASKSVTTERSVKCE